MASSNATGIASAPAESGEPPNARIVLGSLILVAGVANLNLSVANVALRKATFATDRFRLATPATRISEPRTMRAFGGSPLSAGADAIPVALLDAMLSPLCLIRSCEHDPGP